jgi:hypothetical protein
VADPTKKRTPEQRAIDYAQSLGVDEVYADARAAEGALALAHHDLRAARNMIRTIEDKILDQELHLATVHRPNYDSQSAFDRAFKGICHDDSSWLNYHDQLREMQTARDLAEDKVREAEMAHRTAAARMTELGGLLTFYAAVKTKQSIITEPDEG